MKTPFGTEVDLGPGHIVLAGVPALRERGTAAPTLFGPCLLSLRSPISVTAELLVTLFLGSRRARSRGPILTICTSYDVLPRNEVPFGGRNETAPHLGGEIPQNPNLGA